MTKNKVKFNTFRIKPSSSLKYSNKFKFRFEKIIVFFYLNDSCSTGHHPLIWKSKMLKFLTVLANDSSFLSLLHKLWHLFQLMNWCIVQSVYLLNRINQYIFSFFKLFLNYKHFTVPRTNKTNFLTVFVWFANCSMFTCFLLKQWYIFFQF